MAKGKLTNENEAIDDSTDNLANLAKKGKKSSTSVQDAMRENVCRMDNRNSSAANSAQILLKKN